VARRRASPTRPPRLRIPDRVSQCGFAQREKAASADRRAWSPAAIRPATCGEHVCAPCSVAAKAGGTRGGRGARAGGGGSADGGPDGTRGGGGDGSTGTAGRRSADVMAAQTSAAITSRHTPEDAVPRARQACFRACAPFRGSGDAGKAAEELHGIRYAHSTTSRPPPRPRNHGVACARAPSSTYRSTTACHSRIRSGSARWTAIIVRRSPSAPCHL
jgi:hypothetical protein